METVQSIPNGYIKYFYVLGSKTGDGFMNHNIKSNKLVTDLLRAKKFDTVKEALEYYKKVKCNYLEELISHRVRVIVELI